MFESLIKEGQWSHDIGKWSRTPMFYTTQSQLETLTKSDKQQRKGKNVPKTAKTILRNNQWTVKARTSTKKKRNPDRHQLRTIIKLLRVTMAALKKT